MSSVASFGWLLTGTWADGEERDIALHTTAEAALIDRDKRRKNCAGHVQPTFRVYEEGKKDKGELDWCACGKKASLDGRCPGDES